MNLKCQAHNSVELVSLPPRLVMANAAETRGEIKSLVEAGRTRLVLDLQSVEFVDSSGLSVLVSTLKAVHAANGEVVLLSPSDGVRMLIELTRLHQVFEIFEDRRAAIQRLS
ncbi:MAG: STAS domain-containing protein [Gammaproteobacteria bacterium]